MQNIKLNRLLLENFKCHAYLKLEFDGRNASIYGDNATGKTSIYDALTWLLFGKDSSGNGEKNIDIKPLNEAGEVIDHSAITSVEAEFLADGETVTFRRTYREVWSTKRGSSVETYDGNTSEYFVDGVPQKKYAYDARIKELVPEDTFRLLTSVSYFASDLKWQDRRNVLFDMAGTMTDREIMARDPRFQPLMESMGRLSLDDYRKKLAAERKGFLGVKDETPTRLNECQKALQGLSVLNFDAARAAVEELEAKKADISGQLIAAENDSAVESKRLEIREARLALDQLEGENRAFRAQQTAGTPDVALLQRQLGSLNRRKDSAYAMLRSAERDIAEHGKSIDSSRERWISVNGETFTGGVCPTCGQQLPFDQLKTATAAFEESKRRRLQEIERTAESQKQAKIQVEQRIKAIQEDIAGCEAEIGQLESEIQKARASTVTPVDMEGYTEARKAAQDKIAVLDKQLTEMLNGSAEVRSALRGELEILRAQIAENQKIVAQEGMVDYYRTRMDQIRTEAQHAAAALEAIEKMLYLADEYTRFKTSFVENGVNRLFRIAKFRLYREQANGGVEDRCDVVFNGVPYMGLNNGAKINVGIDIINALSRHYGVTVPLFVDNAESVTRLEECRAQVIRLVVSEEDKELRLEYEN